MKTPLEMIAEWRKGCTDGGQLPDRPSPAHCAECTEALIDALERALLQPNAAMIAAGVSALRTVSVGIDPCDDAEETVRSMVAAAMGAPDYR